jgi:hypothetical protein
MSIATVAQKQPDESSTELIKYPTNCWLEMPGIFLLKIRIIEIIVWSNQPELLQKIISIKITELK